MKEYKDMTRDEAYHLGYSAGYNRALLDYGLEDDKPRSCDTCKHNGNEWDEEPCDNCCGNNNGYEPQDGDLISRQELEDIKAEIKGEMSNPVELSKNRALFWVLEILDKHIGERSEDEDSN